MICKETETVEFKKTTAELKEAVISIVAMLNKHGRAKVYFVSRLNYLTYSKNAFQLPWQVGWADPSAMPHR